MRGKQASAAALRCWPQDTRELDWAADYLPVRMLKKIPTSGDWPAQQRLRWLRTFAMNVSQIHDDEAMEPAELKIDLEAAN